MDPDTVAEWCGEHSSQSECCTVMDIPADTWAEDQIRQAVATLAPDHRGLILDIEKNPDTSHMYVLLEWRKGVPPCFQGTSMKLAEEVEVQLIKPSTPRGESASVSVPSPLAMIGPEFIVAIGDLLAKCQKTSPPHTNFGYRRLRNFTGNVPTPAGEETFEEWVEQAMQALDEWDVPEAQKKQRITESLKGPASEAVRNLKLSRKDCTALDYLNVLEEVFGRTEKAAELKRLQSQVLKWKELFSKDEFDVGLAKSTEHRIRLQEDKPFRERSRRVPLGDLDDLREQLNELQRTKVIQESRSPYASPIVLVRKKNGSVRLCIDYRTLNRRTIPDQYATPRIEDALQCLSGAKWFSVLDLRSGYHQIPMHPEDREKTAFICPLGFFEFNRMPQGLTGAPATFQRLMEKTVGDMNLIEVLVYLDDIIVFGKTLEEHEQRLEKVLKRLHEEGLKLSLEKCQFCLPSVTYLGHVVSAEGVSTDPRKLE
uniref:ribonuclease H n=1 Tax=Leptobrachium leishanense TaxID=445787 RepID=A0A8C5WC41_9ANUR